jgi:hypothetical protein
MPTPDPSIYESLAHPWFQAIFPNSLPISKWASRFIIRLAHFQRGRTARWAAMPNRAWDRVCLRKPKLEVKGSNRIPRRLSLASKIALLAKKPIRPSSWVSSILPLGFDLSVFDHPGRATASVESIWPNASSPHSFPLPQL